MNWAFFWSESWLWDRESRLLSKQCSELYSPKAQWPYLGFDQWLDFLNWSKHSCPSPDLISHFSQSSSTKPHGLLTSAVPISPSHSHSHYKSISQRQIPKPMIQWHLHKWSQSQWFQLLSCDSDISRWRHFIFARALARQGFFGKLGSWIFIMSAIFNYF